jgi:hypothetical protein
MRSPFSPSLFELAQAEPSAIQVAAMKAMELWALLGSAQAEADARRDDHLSFRFALIDAALSLPEAEHDYGATT